MVFLHAFHNALFGFVLTFHPSEIVISDEFTWKSVNLIASLQFLGKKPYAISILTIVGIIHLEVS